MSRLRITLFLHPASSFHEEVRNPLPPIFQPYKRTHTNPDTANPPTIKTPTWTTSSNGIIMMVDTDVPRNGNRVQLLHWLVSGVTLSQSDNSTLIIPSEAEASYRQPSPPVGDSPHAYTILLFPQPDDFDVPSQFQDVLQTRVFFDAKGFADAAGFGEPVAANYIRVQNTSGTPTQSFPPAAGSATATGVGTGGNGSNTSVPAPFPGGAAGLGDRAWVAGIGTAVVAGLMGFFL